MDALAGGVDAGRGTVSSNRLRARYVTEDNRRFDAARTIGLHPTVAGKAEARQLLAEVFHHVIALGFAVHEHVDAQFFLFGDGEGNLFFHRRFVVCGGKFIALEGCARGADFGCLREGTNRRRRQQRQGETLALRGLTCRERRAIGGSVACQRLFVTK